MNAQEIQVFLFINTRIGTLIGYCNRNNHIVIGTLCLNRVKLPSLHEIIIMSVSFVSQDYCTTRSLFTRENKLFQSLPQYFCLFTTTTTTTFGRAKTVTFPIRAKSLQFPNLAYFNPKLFLTKGWVALNARLTSLTHQPPDPQGVL